MLNGGRWKRRRWKNCLRKYRTWPRTPYIESVHRLMKNLVRLVILNSHKKCKTHACTHNHHRVAVWTIFGYQMFSNYVTSTLPHLDNSWPFVDWAMVLFMYWLWHMTQYSSCHNRPNSILCHKHQIFLYGSYIIWNHFRRRRYMLMSRDESLLQKVMQTRGANTFSFVLHQKNVVCINYVLIVGLRPVAHPYCRSRD